MQPKPISRIAAIRRWEPDAWSSHKGPSSLYDRVENEIEVTKAEVPAIKLQVASVVDHICRQAFEWGEKAPQNHAKRSGLLSKRRVPTSASSRIQTASSVPCQVLGFSGILS